MLKIRQIRLRGDYHWIESPDQIVVWMLKIGNNNRVNPRRLEKRGSQKNITGGGGSGIRSLQTPCIDAAIHPCVHLSIWYTAAEVAIDRHIYD